jgi:hypothetical protein
VYFVIRTMYDKDETEYTGPESFVRKMIDAQSVDFFPINQVSFVSADATLPQLLFRFGHHLWPC